MLGLLEYRRWGSVYEDGWNLQGSWERGVRRGSDTDVVDVRMCVEDGVLKGEILRGTLQLQNLGTEMILQRW